jgi:hypothetical protein
MYLSVASALSASSSYQFNPPGYILPSHISYLVRDWLCPRAFPVLVVRIIIHIIDLTSNRTQGFLACS